MGFAPSFGDRISQTLNMVGAASMVGINECLIGLTFYTSSPSSKVSTWCLFSRRQDILHRM
ncbi:hypothetical protein PanWU01x14_052840 [Parasponia andersonii]|uniref:Uncharacterized protein n=1 Tax=Parasponia andersonii TaxID=3476 RepID=A0A2P5DLB8_PARAD|nr:hypothetical protein PanWU01x14_052840 [Parasponia andersonii]